MGRGLASIVARAVVIVFAASLLAGGRSGAAVSGLEVAAAGDLCGDSCRQTAELAAGADLVLPLGDLAYPNATLAALRSQYDPAWGRWNAIAEPAPGNHEWNVANAQGFRDYFGLGNGPMYRSWDRAGWHFVLLDTTKMDRTQAIWLRDDLAADGHRCQVAYGHHPRWSSGANGSVRKVHKAWTKLDRFDVDLYVAGHDHDYERIFRDGIRQFVSGLGGKSRTAFRTTVAGSEVRYNADYGVLHLTLGDGTYAWSFETIGGKVIDAGEDVCR